jgi:hypothetical protein
VSNLHPPDLRTNFTQAKTTHPKNPVVNNANTSSSLRSVMLDSGKLCVDIFGIYRELSNCLSMLI